MYSTRLLSKSHTNTFLHALPAVTFAPSGDQPHLSIPFSKLCWCPTKYFTHLSSGAYDRTSHARSVQSIALVSTCDPSGATAMPVMVSVCPGRTMYGSASLRMSQHFKTLSRPPLKNLSPSASNATAVTWNLSANVATSPLRLKSHSFAVPSSEPDTHSGFPLGAAEHALTKDWCPFMHFTDSPVVASQSRNVLSGEHVRMLSPSAVQCSSSTEFL